MFNSHYQFGRAVISWIILYKSIKILDETQLK